MSSREIAKDILLAAMEHEFVVKENVVMGSEKEGNDKNIKHLTEAYQTIFDAVEKNKPEPKM